MRVVDLCKSACAHALRTEMTRRAVGMQGAKRGGGARGSKGRETKKTGSGRRRGEAGKARKAERGEREERRKAEEEGARAYTQVAQ